MLKHASLIISLILAGLYCLGLTHYQGFLLEFGLEETQFQLSVDRLFFHGFIALAGMSAKTFLWLVAAASGVVIIAHIVSFVAFFISKYDFSKWIPKKLAESEAPEANHFVEFSLKMFAYVLLLFFAFLGILLVLVASENSGKASAERFKQNTLDKPELMVTIKTKNDQYSGRSIVCSDTQCAYWLTSDSIVLNKRDVSLVQGL